MGKISGYANDSTPNVGDKLIGTDVNDLNATKNFTIGQILSLGASSGLLVPYTGATGPVNLGSNSITSNSFIKAGGTSSQFLKADGSVDSTTYATAASVTALAPKYGSFYDTTLQTALAANTAYPIKLNSTDNTATNGFVVDNDGFGNATIIKAASAGVYNVAFSAQIQRTTGGSLESVNFWLRRNNTNLPWTNTFVNVQANSGYLVAAWNFFVQLDAGSQFQLMWSTSSTAIQLVFGDLTAVHPATPSVILTVNKVG